MEAKIITCVESCSWCTRMACRHRGEVGHKCTAYMSSKRLDEPIENDFTNFGETWED